VSVDFDVMWDTNNSTMSIDYFNNPPSGSSLFLRAVKTNGVAGTKEFFTLTGNFTIPDAASNGWAHVSVPITSSSNALCKGIYFVKTGITGVSTNGGIAQFWIDNVTLKAPTNPAVAILDSDNFQSYPLGQDLTTGGYGWSIYVNNNTNVVWYDPTVTSTPATNQYAATVVDSSALPTQGTYWSGTIYSGVRPMPAGISTNLAQIQLNLNVVEIGNYTHQTAPVKLMLQSLAANGTTVTGESDLTVPVWYQWMNTIGGVLTNFTPTSYQTYSTNGAVITTNIVYTPFDPTAPKYRYSLYIDNGWEFLVENNNVIKVGNMILSNPNAQAAVTPPTITLNTPTNNASYVAYGNIPLSATVNSNNNTISYVQFLSGATVLAAVTNPPYAATWNFVAPGSYPAVTAHAIYGSGSVTSAVAAVTVNAAVAPAVSAPTQNGNGYSFSISGPTGQPYTILTTTNVALPLSSWSVARTNSAFVAGSASYTNSTPNDPQRYYRVKTP
jgi:Bacterial Ig domain